MIYGVKMVSVLLMAVAVIMGVDSFVPSAAQSAEPVPSDWSAQWPKTDFSKSEIPFSEILSGGPSKDGIPAIDEPKFKAIGEVTRYAPSEPVILLTIKGESRIYPLQVMTWHEIVNDTLAGVPVVVTYCPLCNAAIVFERRVAGRILDFGTTGKLRNSDLVMYDRQSESWWQQFSGRAIVGEMVGTELTMLPARLESFSRATAAAPDARVLVPSNPNARAYGNNPYVGYDSAAAPFLYDGEMPENINPMMRVVVVNGEAWSLPLLQSMGRIINKDVVLIWNAGQNSALDTRDIAKGNDVGNVRALQKSDEGIVDVVYHVTFAFVFYAFHPDGVLHQ